MQPIKHETYRQNLFVLDKDKAKASSNVKEDFVWRLQDVNQDPVYTGDVFKYLRKSDGQLVLVVIGKQTARILRSINVYHHDPRTKKPRGKKFLVHASDLGIYWHQAPKAKVKLTDLTYLDKNEQRLNGLKIAIEARIKSENRLAAESLITATTNNRRISHIAQDFLIEPKQLTRYRDGLIAKYIDPATTDDEIDSLSKFLPATRTTLRNIRLEKLRVEQRPARGRL